MPAPWLRPAPGGVDLLVLVVPRASRTRAMGVHDGRLKIQLAAPPTDGQANAALLDYLADSLGVRKSQLELVEGQASRRKVVRAREVDAAAVEAVMSGA